jgi:hypothetical protein
MTGITPGVAVVGLGAKDMCAIAEIIRGLAGLGRNTGDVS